MRFFVSSRGGRMKQEQTHNPNSLLKDSHGGWLGKRKCQYEDINRDSMKEFTILDTIMTVISFS